TGGRLSGYWGTDSLWTPGAGRRTDGDRCGATPAALAVAGLLRSTHRDRPAAVRPGRHHVLALVGRGRSSSRHRGSRLGGCPSRGARDHRTGRGDRPRTVLGVRARRRRRPAPADGHRRGGAGTAWGGPSVAGGGAGGGRDVVVRRPA